MRKLAACIGMVALCATGAVTWRTARMRGIVAYVPSGHESWNPKSAAAYLDSREVWWQRWPVAQMDHGTVCISCHTVLPYALVRPILRQRLGENGMAVPEQAMLASIRKRVTDWSEMIPYYTDAVNGPGKTQESHATEAVLNAIILSHYDAGDGGLSALARQAFDEAWALQEKTGDNAGGWKWQNSHLAPWESSESAYQGAAMMAVALSEAPENYASETEIHDNVELLKQYLRRRYDAQPLMSKLYALWASARTPGLISSADQVKLVGEVADLQLNDGGWALSSLDEQSRRHALLDDWKRLTSTAQSDGCATGLVILVLEKVGAKQHDTTMQRGLAWLKRNQTVEGSWRAASLNEARDENSDIGRFMSDAATGYAVLALQTARVNQLTEPETDTNEHQEEMNAMQRRLPLGTARYK